MKLINECALLCERGNYSIMAKTACNGLEEFSSTFSVRADGITSVAKRTDFLIECSDIIEVIDTISEDAMLGRSKHAEKARASLGSLVEAVSITCSDLMDRKMNDEPVDPRFDASNTLIESTLLAENEVHAQYRKFVKSVVHQHKDDHHKERFKNIAKKWHAHKKKNGINTKSDQKKAISSSKKEIIGKAADDKAKIDEKAAKDTAQIDKKAI